MELFRTYNPEGKYHNLSLWLKRVIKKRHEKTASAVQYNITANECNVVVKLYDR